MKGIVSVPIVLMLILLPACDQDKKNVMEKNVGEIKFEDVPSTGLSAGALSFFQIRLDLAAGRGDTNNSLDLNFSLTYEGDTSITVHNPVYWLKFNLFDQNKQSIPLKQKPPVLLLNLNRKIDPKKDFPFIITGAEKDGESWDHLDAINQPLFKFEPGTNYGFSIQLDVDQQIHNPVAGHKPYYIQFYSTIVPQVANEEPKTSRALQTAYIPISE